MRISVKYFATAAALSFLIVLLFSGAVYAQGGAAIDGFDYDSARQRGNALAEEYLNEGVLTLTDCGTDPQHECLYEIFNTLSSVLGYPNPDGTAYEICLLSTGRSRAPEGCFYKMGHIFLKHSEYALTPALALCDTLSREHQSECHEGVFAENVNAFLSSTTAGNESFSGDDPLAPCSTIDERYRSACYGQHGQYLVGWFGGDLSNALTTCDTLPRHAERCRQSVIGTQPGAGIRGVVGTSAANEENLPWSQRLIRFILRLLNLE